MTGSLELAGWRSTQHSHLHSVHFGSCETLHLQHFETNAILQHVCGPSPVSGSHAFERLARARSPTSPTTTSTPCYPQPSDKNQQPQWSLKLCWDRRHQLTQQTLNRRDSFPLCHGEKWGCPSRGAQGETVPCDEHSSDFQQLGLLEGLEGIRILVIFQICQEGEVSGFVVSGSTSAVL